MWKDIITCENVIDMEDDVGLIFNMCVYKHFSKMLTKQDLRAF